MNIEIKQRVNCTFDTVDADTEDDSDDADSDSGEPARLIFLRLRGRPFNFGAEINIKQYKKRHFHLHSTHIFRSISVLKIISSQRTQSTFSTLKIRDPYQTSDTFLGLYCTF